MYKRSTREDNMNLRNSIPWFIENSKIPVWMSYMSPITIHAITLGPLVLSAGEMSDGTKRHETIHWQQYIELGIVGFIILYFAYWFIGLVKYRNGAKAYMSIPFEQEAYGNHDDEVYLLNRKRYHWRNYKV